MGGPFKMKGMDFGNSPVTKKAGPETKQYNIDDENQDSEYTIEEIKNDFDYNSETGKFDTDAKGAKEALKKYNLSHPKTYE